MSGIKNERNNDEWNKNELNIELNKLNKIINCR